VSKPLELTIYPKWNGYYRGADELPIANTLAADSWSSAKRLTEPELAAEYWYAIGRYATQSGIASAARWLEEARTMHRFATLPHYDEDYA
jgi:hypothetical protein